jgi:cytoskeletal protein CcmA (bactofilin family)
MWTQEQKREGRPQPVPSLPAVAAKLPDERRVIAWVGKSVIFKGELTSSEDMTIDGRVEGSIEIPNHMLTVGPDADIRADVVADSVTIFGNVTGTITARAKVDIRETGSVEGNIVSPRLSMTDGALLRGRVETQA